MSIKLAAFGASAALLAILSFGSFYVVDQGERGVVTRNGAILAVNEPGLGFKMPIMDGVTTIDVRSKAKTYESVMAYSADQQTATLTVSVNYAIPGDKAGIVYAEYGNEENLMSRLVERKLMAQVKNCLLYTSRCV